MTIIAIIVIIIMPPPLIGGALSDAFVWRLTSVYLLRTSGLSREHREQRGLGRSKLTQR